jgi:hypothetical protein
MIMTEKLLQFIWQFQYFNQSDLTTVAGEQLEIIRPGKWNHDQGPDFTDAQIRIDGTFLAGSVELHQKSAQWEMHGHSRDTNYNNVILHVVLEDDLPVKSSLPVLELQQRIPRLLLDKYEQLMQAPSFIACSGNLPDVKEITWTSWKERLLAERLTRKSSMVLKFLEETKGNWEESYWWSLARNFGTKVNTEAFEAMGRSLPFAVLARHRQQIHQLEALLLGQAGLLHKRFRDHYPRMLQKEYHFLSKKYQLKPICLPVHFLRMRPGNFPTVRLAQLAALLQQTGFGFSGLLEAKDPRTIEKIFSVTANDYWHYHYLPDEASSFRKKTLGKEMIDSLFINTVVSTVFAYGLHHGEEHYKAKAISWLENTAAESNAITRGFEALGVKNRSAFDSQALIELKTCYCNDRRCLQCAIGNAILGKREAAR